MWANFNLTGGSPSSFQHCRVCLTSSVLPVIPAQDNRTLALVAWFLGFLVFIIPIILSLFNIKQIFSSYSHSYLPLSKIRWPSEKDIKLPLTLFLTFLELGSPKTKTISLIWYSRSFTCHPSPRFQSHCLPFCLIHILCMSFVTFLMMPIHAQLCQASMPSLILSQFYPESTSHFYFSTDSYSSSTLYIQGSISNFSKTVR